MGRVERIAEAMIRATTCPAEAGDDAVRHAREDDGLIWHVARVQARAAIAVLREPEQPDDEVWSCACCHQIVDRAKMERVALINAN